MLLHRGETVERKKLGQTLLAKHLAATAEEEKLSRLVLTAAKGRADAEAHRALARYCETANRLPRAILEWEEVLRIAPKDPEAIQKIARLKTQRGDLPRLLIKRVCPRGNATRISSIIKTMNVRRLALALTLIAPLSSGLAASPQNGKRVTPPKKTAQDEIKQLLAGAPKPEQWPNASKVTMHDFADVTIRPDGSSRTVTRQTIRIFAARARDEGEIKIPYNGSFETVKLIRARTIRPSGQVVEVKPSEIRSAAPSDYDDAKVLSFSMPAVEPGAILDYEYVTDQKASQLPGHHWSQWYFQSGFDPVLHTRLTVNVPKTLSLRTQMRNTKVEPKKQVSADGCGRATPGRARTSTRSSPSRS